VQLFRFITKKLVMMHGHMNVNISTFLSTLRGFEFA